VGEGAKLNAIRVVLRRERRNQRTMSGWGGTRAVGTLAVRLTPDEIFVCS
jgi:hypothetical protein